MTFCFSQQKSVELFTDISNLFAKCRLKFLATFLYQCLNIADIMHFPADRRWNFPLINYICLQNVDGNFHRHLFSYWEYRWYFTFVSKTSAENFNDILHILYFQNVDVNFHRRSPSSSKSHSNLQGFKWNILSYKFTKNTGSPSSRCEELLFFLKKSLCGTFSSWNKLSWHSYRCHLLLHNDLTRSVTLAFQHVEVLCYNSLNLQMLVWGKTLKGILAEILIFFQQKMTYLNALLSFLFSPRFSARSDGGHIRSPSGLPG